MGCPAVFTAGLLGLTGVIAGAYGSHGLKGKVSADQQNAFLTGAHYQILHSCAMLAALAMRAAITPRSPSAAGHLLRGAWLFAIGTLLFSGSIYARTFGAPKSLGTVAPVGGVTMMAGWGCIMLASMAL